MDPRGLTFACATAAEERAARRAGLRTARVGLAGANGLPDGPVVSFGLAGALDGLRNGTVVDAVRVVDERGETLWEGEPLGVPGAVRATVLAASHLVDDPLERARLRRETGADVVDLESGVLAGSGRLRGVLRAVGDTPERPLGAIAAAVSADGAYRWAGIARGFARSPRAFVRAAGDGKRALDLLSRAAARWVSGVACDAAVRPRRQPERPRRRSRHGLLAASQATPWWRGRLRRWPGGPSETGAP